MTGTAGRSSVLLGGSGNGLTEDTPGLRASQHAVLSSYQLLDVPAVAELDAVVRVAATIAGAPRATVNLLDTDRQCQLSTHGFIGADAPREESVCHTTSRAGRVFSSADLSADPHFADNPFVDGRRDRLRQYASVPLEISGVVVGTLCVFDTVVRELTPAQLDRLVDLAEVVVALLERRREMRETEELARESERARAELARAHAELEKSRAFDHALLEALPVGVVAADCDGRLSFFNRVSREWHGSDAGPDLDPTQLAHHYDLFEVDGRTPLPADRVPLVRAMRMEQVSDVEMVIAPWGRAARTVRCSALPVRDSAGRFLGAVAVMDDVTGQREMEHQLRRAALHDVLTGLPNRSLLVDRLEHALAAAPRDGGQVAVLYCDLDGFKSVNDRHGHAAGDDVLREAAARMAHAVRPGDTVGRIGGDEFVVICPQVDSAASAYGIAARIEAALVAPVYSADGTAHRVGVSVGMVLSQLQSTPETMLTDADTMMYEVKRGRRLVDQR
jgi:diguanylate cyclase (GGDEF)-like protein